MGYHIVIAVKVSSNLFRGYNTLSPFHHSLPRLQVAEKKKKKKRERRGIQKPKCEIHNHNRHSIVNGSPLGTRADLYLSTERGFKLISLT